MNHSRMLTAFLLTCVTAGCAAHAVNGQRHVAAHSSKSSSESRCAMAGSVLKNLQAGQTGAIAAALRMRRQGCYAGSTLEDLDVAMGDVFFAHPRTVHGIFAQQRVTTTEAQDFLQATPWSYVDRFCAQERLFQQRIAAVKALPATSFDRTKVVAALQDTLQMVTQACSEHPEGAETGTSK
jgi:hypothetical protein